MSDYIELDFHAVETNKSGDAIALRYSLNGQQRVHVVDGGYLETGDDLAAHIKKFYGVSYIDHVILTHTDRDHVNGLRKILEHFTVGTLWMNRPWIYAAELIQRFENYNSVDRLESKLRSLYSAATELEDLAIEKGIPIGVPLQGTVIGAFTVLAPSKARYLDLIATSERTPALVPESAANTLYGLIADSVRAAVNLVKAAWGAEFFPASGTSEENEMSVIQYAEIVQSRILLTGDTGRDGLSEAADYLTARGIGLPGLALFQVPHHGGRHNVSSATLDRWLGPKLMQLPENTNFSAVCSSAKADEHHPKKSVIRAILHRGGHFSATEGRTLHWSRGISREGWSSVPQHEYPDSQEEHE